MARSDPHGSGDTPAQTMFVISVAAELAGMHPQTLRQYDRLGLVTPARTKGRGRRYTTRDIQRLRDVQRMSQEEGINLAGIRQILDLEQRVEALEALREAHEARIGELEARRDRVFAATPSGRVSQLRRGERAWGATADATEAALVPWTPWYRSDLAAFMEAVAAMRSHRVRSIGAGPTSGERAFDTDAPEYARTPSSAVPTDGHTVVDGTVVDAATPRASRAPGL